MKQKGNLLKNVAVDPGEIELDHDRFRVIVEDLASNGGIFTPRSNWITLDYNVKPDEDGRNWLDLAYTPEVVDARMSTMEQMLDPWVGSHQMKAARESIDRYGEWLREHDPLGLWKANVDDPTVAERLWTADLGTILDVNLLWSFTPHLERPRSILEVGGGYGRLAEAMLNLFADVKYVLVDGVPGSLFYSYEYLRRACPTVRIGSYYHDDAFDMERFDCYVVPSWHFEALNTSTYDVCVNIESFQEMGQDQVDAFLGIFDRVTSDGAVVYVSNHHDPVVKSANTVLPAISEWNYPASWRQVLCSNTPRSSTPNHPTEVFVKEPGDWSRANESVRAAHLWQVKRQPEPLVEPVRDEAYRLLRRMAGGARRRLQTSLSRGRSD
jgi:hypothetical protein